MTPAARTESAIGLLDQILSQPQQPADRTVAAWFRQRRYAGAKDRTYVTNLVYGILRRRGALEWALGHADAGESDARALVLAWLVKDEGLPDDDLVARFSGAEHAPTPLAAAEQSLLTQLRAAPAPQPDWVRGEYPPMLDDSLREVFGDDIVSEMAAVAERAPVDLRVNTLRADRDQAMASLARENIVAQPTPLSPLGLRLDGRANVAGSAAYRDGLVEVQDEGSQLIAAVVGAQPGETVIDWCAGGGGKTLALAAAMQNQGRLLAFDTSAERLEAATHRVARAGATIIETHPLPESAALVSSLTGSADRVLVDAPCSGSGAWRRNPAAKWRTTPATIAEYAARQREILAQAADAVRPGGSLVYATCSLFRAENHAQVDSFLVARRDYRLGSVATRWRQLISDDPPSEMPLLLLTPLGNNTDGFFIAVFERKA
ncbi:MAG: RsmB/NOP family class I SAM-dependent RNA methyltransferase [Alphaproteobacteria bacterium]|nr:RsmB/NOP family class I SAM-dependent RNA methyltransferase [Alphaproteobacteria bacterium]